jgi:hypothetical protein
MRRTRWIGKPTPPPVRGHSRAVHHPVQKVTRASPSVKHASPAVHHPYPAGRGISPSVKDGSPAGKHPVRRVQEHLTTVIPTSLPRNRTSPTGNHCLPTRNLTARTLQQLSSPRKHSSPRVRLPSPLAMLAASTKHQPVPVRSTVRRRRSRGGSNTKCSPGSLAPKRQRPVASILFALRAQRGPQAPRDKSQI